MLHRLKQRQKQWLAEEKGTIIKDWGGKVPVALAFPNRYAVGMSNLGFQAVYGLLNRQDGVVCERVFYPEPEDQPLLREKGASLLSVESQRPLGDFHLVAFCVPFENDYTNLLEMLLWAGLPVRSSRRTSRHPLVAVGGVAAFLNPEPLAPFVDFFFVGEAEALLPDFWAFWEERSKEPEERDRSELLALLTREVPGIYAPGLYEPVYGPKGELVEIRPQGDGPLPRRVSYRRADLSRSPVCRTVILTPHTEFSSVALLEMGRGCGRSCRFCAAGYVYRPPRFHGADRLLEAAKVSLLETSRIGLVSAAVSDHPEADAVCRCLTEAGASLSFSSLRADSVSPDTLKALEAGGHHAVAIAPEAGSERLRRVINKHLSDEQILQAAEKLASIGVLHLKLYFMIGLPTEDKDDVEAIVDLAKRIKHHVLQKSRGLKRLGEITVSVNSFVPKPFTPFQWWAFVGVKELKERARWIQNGLRKVPNVRVHFDLPKWAYVQAVLARGDRRVATFLEKVAVEGLSWKQAMREAPVNPDFWVRRERGPDEVFPWEIVDYGIRRSHLWEEYQRALKAEESRECRVDEKCRRCGVCGAREGRQSQCC